MIKNLIKVKQIYIKIIGVTRCVSRNVAIYVSLLVKFVVSLGKVSELKCDL